MINTITLIGHLGRDPELRDAGSSKVCSVSLATKRNFKRGDDWDSETQWHEIVGWGPMAERLSRFKKGNLLYVEGSMNYGSYEKEGHTFKTAKVRLNVIRSLTPKGDGAAQPAQPARPTSDSDNDLPF